MKKILIVEDEAIVSTALERLLVKSGYDVVSVINAGENVVPFLKDNPTDLILMDIRLKGRMDGIKTAGLIKSEFDIPLIFLTAYSDEKISDYIDSINTYGFLVKPFNERELISNIEIALYKHTMEKKLKKSEEQLSYITENSKDIIFQTDLNGNITYISNIVFDILGYSANEILGKKFTQFITLKNKEHSALLDKLLQGDIVDSNEFPVIYKNTSIKHLEFKSAPIAINGKKIGFQGIARDITEKKYTYEIQQKWAHIFEHAEWGIVICTPDGDNFEMMNPAFSRMHGYAITELMGNPIATVFFSECKNDLKKNIKLAFINNHHTFESKLIRKDQTVFPAFIDITVVKDRKGYILYLIIIAQDISKQKESENRIRQLSKEIMNSQENERQRIAKDLHDSVSQTILAAKLNFIEYQNSPSKSEDRLHMGMEFLSRATEELREIYTGLYPSILNDIGLEATIRWYAKNYLVINNINFNFVYAIKDSLNHELKVSFFRIIQELFANILKHAQATDVELQFSHQEDNTITLIVSDNGIGFDVDKAYSDLKGFGLHNILQRVESFGGLLNIHSWPRQGTQIIIKIPEISHDEQNNNIPC